MSESLALSLPDEVVDGYDALLADSGLYEMQNSGLIELTGEDRAGWLQGQITNDVRGFRSGGSMHFCFCSPTGQIVAYCEMWALEDRFLIRAHKTAIPAILECCEQTILLSQVDYRDLSAEYRLVSIQGPTATRRLREWFELPPLDAGSVSFEGQDVICLRSRRTALGGWDLLLPRAASDLASKIEASFNRIPEAAFDAARLEAGFPRTGSDIDARTLPPELGPAFEAKTVSFNKGCYVGQEVLARIKSRGHTNRTWVGLLCTEPTAKGDEVFAGRQSVGVVTSTAVSPQFGVIAGAMVKNEFAGEGEQLMVAGAAAEVRQFPILRFD